MKVALYLAAALILAVGIVHSWLGERYILMRLFRRDNLPQLFGSTDFTTRTLRFTWHLLTVAWLGFAVILLQLAGGGIDAGFLGLAIGIVFLVHFGVALIASRARHLSWVVFLAIGALAIYATRN